MPRGNVCAVFSNPDKTDRSTYRGIITPADLTDNPDALASDIMTITPAEVSDSQPIVEVLKLLRSDGADNLPVFDSSGKFIGVICQRSIMEALLKRERELLRKTREFRQTAQDDKERRYETTRRLEQTNLAFRKLLSALARPESLDSFKQALEALTVVADAGWAQLAICDEHGRITQRVLASHPSVRSYPPNYQAEQLVQMVIAENRIINRPGSAGPAASVGASGDDTPTDADPARSRVTAYLGLPLAMDDRRFGCVYLWDKLTGRVFIDDDEILLASLAHAVSITLSHAIDLSRRKRLEYELDLLAVIAREVGGANNIETVADVVRKHTEGYWSWDAFILCIARAHTKRFMPVIKIDKAVAEPVITPARYTAGQFADMPSEGLNSSSSVQVNRRILSGEPVLINRQALQEVQLMRPFGNVHKPSASLIYVPIHGSKRVIGCLSIQSYQMNRYGFPDVKVLERVADAVAPAFRRCLAEQTTHAFFGLAKKLAAAYSPQEAARIIVDVADELLGWDCCFVLFYDSARDMHTQVLIVDSHEGQRVEFQVEDKPSAPGGLSRRAIQEGPLLHLRPQARFEDNQSNPFGYRNKPSASLMYVPLKFNDKTIGIVSIQSYDLNAYDEDDLELLIALADQCSGAIERIRKAEL